MLVTRKKGTGYLNPTPIKAVSYFNVQPLLNARYTATPSYIRVGRGKDVMDQTSIEANKAGYTAIQSRMVGQE